MITSIYILKYSNEKIKISSDYYPEEVVQTGVMVFTPKQHREVLEYVYYNYEEKGLNYEMRPLSKE